MARSRCFSDDQVRILARNTYTHSVTPYMIRFTVEFKEFLYAQTKVPGMSTAKIFEAAGYDVSMFNRRTLDEIRYRIVSAARSGKGFTTSGKSEAEKAAAFAAKDLSRQKTDKAIRELQEQVVHLQQQIEFLKKISSIRNRTEE